MRILILVVMCGGLAFSAIAANRYYENRPSGLGDELFVHEDPAARAEWAKKEKALGSALSAYEQLARADHGNHEAVWNGIRTLLLIGGTGYSEPRLPKRLASYLSVDYARVRPHVDPDGSRLHATVKEWQALRMRSEDFHVKAGTAIWLAARGAEEGHARIRVFIEKGPFYSQFFSYIANERPHWRGVKPVVEHYLSGDDLRGRVEAGVAALEYNLLYGVGKDVLDRSLRDIRAAFREYKADLKPGLDPLEQARAESCVFGMAILAHLGHEEERRVLEAMWNNKLQNPEVVEVLKVARMLAGLEDFRKLHPGEKATKFERQAHTTREYYYRGLILRYIAARADPAKKAEAEWMYELIDDGVLDSNGSIASACHRALARFERKRLAEVAKKNLAYKLRFAARNPKTADPLFVVQWLSHQDPGMSGLAAAILRNDLPAVSILQDWTD